MEISLSSVIITDFLSSIVFQLDRQRFYLSILFDTPDTAIIESRSHTSTLCPKLSYKASAYSFAKSPSSLIGEYFFKITSPSRSTNISSGSLLEYVKFYEFPSGLLPYLNHQFDVRFQLLSF